MTYLEMEMKELSRNTWNDTHHTTSSILPLEYVSDVLQMEEASTVEEYKHTHAIFVGILNTHLKYCIASSFVKHGGIASVHSFRYFSVTFFYKMFSIKYF